MVITTNTNLARIKRASYEELAQLLVDANRLGRDVTATFNGLRVTARPDVRKTQPEISQPIYYYDVAINENVTTYEQEKLRLGFLLHIGDITRGQYESALKQHIKSHLKKALVTSRHQGSAGATAYQQWLNASQGHGRYNSTEFYKNGGTRWTWLDSLCSKPRKPLVWAED